MTDIQYKSPPIEICEGRTKMGFPCRNPAKDRVNEQNLCGVHATPILRHKARYDTELTALELWERGGSGQRAAAMTDEELHQRKSDIEAVHQSDVSDIQWAKLRAELWAIDYEMKRREKGR